MNWPNRNARARLGGFSGSPARRAFTLIELILVLALLAIMTALVLPRMAGFIHGRSLDSEARRLYALMHAAQSRAVSEGTPVMLWVDEKAGTYGEEAETSGPNGGPNGDPKAEELTVDPTLQISVQSTGTATPVTFKNLPAIRFLPDGTIDEGSPQVLKLTDSVGVSRWLTQTKSRQGYEIDDTGK